MRDARRLPRAVAQPEGLLVPGGLVPDVLGGHALCEDRDEALRLVRRREVEEAAVARLVPGSGRVGGRGRVSLRLSLTLTLSLTLSLTLTLTLTLTITLTLTLTLTLTPILIPTLTVWPGVGVPPKPSLPCYA